MLVLFRRIIKQYKAEEYGQDNDKTDHSYDIGRRIAQTCKKKNVIDVHKVKIHALHNIILYTKANILGINEKWGRTDCFFGEIKYRSLIVIY